MAKPTKEPTQNRKPHIITLVVSGVIMAALIVLIVVFWQPLTELFGNPERARELIAQAGPWGPVVFILMQIAQVLVAPVPGQVTGFVGGFLFGPLLGTVYTTIGAAIGFTLIFVLARKLGRPFVEYFVDARVLRKFDYLAESKGALVLFLIFLLPAFPDDVICYIAGLTTIKIRMLVLISLIGRLPGNALLSLTGAGVAESNMQLVYSIVAIMAVVGAVAYWQRKKIEAWVKRLSAGTGGGQV
jgi:uncharacterized membrane protein YdjX (TVP38/TMEM64 family)